MSRRSASPAEDAIHDLLQTMSQKERDARFDAKHKQLCVSVSRALENAAWTLDEFCNNATDRQTAWTCVDIKILRRVRAEPSRRPPRHRRNACSMAWRCWFITAPRSREMGVPNTLVDFRTGVREF